MINSANLFLGVVEDRNDPEQVGRVRVRIFGDHTEDKTQIPTESLPWAQVMMPVTSASLAGIGDSATGIVQGSWVVGFYLDGTDKQQPLIIGTVPGITSPGNNSFGFSDPLGEHPRRVDEADTPYSAMDFSYTDAESYINKVDLRVEEIEKAVPSKVSSVAVDEPDAYYQRSTWSSPQVQQDTTGEAGSPQYPFNKVKETESGHVFEVDDTPGNERISQYHRSGTNYEIQASGTTTQTFVSDRYTVVFGTDSIYVKGNVNLTIDGDLRQLVKGNYHLEVNGNKTEFVKGSRQSKIGLNENIEINQGLSCNVTENYNQRIGGNETRAIVGERKTKVGTSEDLTVGTNMGTVVMGKYDLFAAQSHSTTTLSTLNVTANGDITVETPSSLIENIDTNQTTTIGGTKTETAPTGNVTYTSGDVTANTVSLVTHIHTGDSDIDGVTGAPQQ